MNNVRVRIAPSPTGPLHIGTARTALYNYLFAKKTNGKFILRIEDTDLERSNEKYVQQIIEGLAWLGIDWDEGQQAAGDQEKGEFGPYRQTKRIKIYKKYLKQLVDQEKAYYCFCTLEELERERHEQAKKGEPPRYSGKCAHLNQAEIAEFQKQRKNSIIRFRMPNEKIIINDLIRGKIEFDCSLLGDISIAKNLNTPLYNFAAAVDDETMQISHVIRGEDHLSNTPKQIILQKALGFKQPVYAHLPMILNEDRSKMSKRKNKVSLIEYREEGYLPEALVNFIALLGWNPKTEQEIFSLSDLANEFVLESVHKSGAAFNKGKLDWMNSHYLRQLKLDELFNRAKPFLLKSNIPFTDKEFTQKALSLEQERIKTLAQIPEAIGFLYEHTLNYKPSLLAWKKQTKAETIECLEELLGFLETLDEEKFASLQGLKTEIMQFIKRSRHKTGDYLWPLRVALSGKKASPGPFEIASVLGKKIVINRVMDALNSL